MALEFEEILPYVEGEGDTGKTAREKINRNFTKIEPLANVGAEMQQLRQDVSDDLEQLHDDVEEMVDKTTSLFGYYNCSTAGATAAKTVQATNYELTTGGNTRIKMEHANTAASPVTLQIGNATAKQLYYNGEAVSDENTWEDNETIVVYYDGTKYLATNSLGGGRKDDDDLSQFFNVIEEQVGGSANLIDPSQYVDGSLNSSGGISGGNYRTTGKMEVEGGATYTFFAPDSNNVIKAARMRWVSTWDSSDSFIETIEVSAQQYTAGSGVKYIRITPMNKYPDAEDRTCLIKGTELPEGDFPYYSEPTIVKYIELDDDNKSVEDKEDNELVTKKNLSDYVDEQMEGIPDISGLSAIVSAIKQKTDMLGIGEEQVGGSTNLLNPEDYGYGFYNSDGSYNSSTSYCTTGYIEIENGKTYTILAPDSNNVIKNGKIRWVCLYDSSDTFIERIEVNAAQFTVNNPNAVKVKITPSYNYLNQGVASSTGLFEGENPEWEAYSPSQSRTYLTYNPQVGLDNKREKELVTKDDIPPEEEGGGGDGDEPLPETTGLTLLYTEGASNDTITLANGTNYIKTSFDKFKSSYYGGNHIFNFLELKYNGEVIDDTDDVAPMHIKGQILGGNHTANIRKITATAHGLTTSDVGNVIRDSANTQFFIMRIIDANTFVVSIKNANAYGTVTFATGNATYGVNTINVSNVDNIGFFPATCNELQEVYADGEKITLSAGLSMSVRQTVDFVDCYDIVNLNEMTELGFDNTNSERIKYSSQMDVRVENTYRFMKDLKVVVIARVIFRNLTFFTDVMFAQCSKKCNESIDVSTSRFYVPGSLPVHGENYAVPKLFGKYQGADITPEETNYIFDSAAWADQTKPVNRVIEISSANTGFAFGYLPVGVGADLTRYTAEPIHLRCNSGKIYPHGVDRGFEGMVDSNGEQSGSRYYMPADNSFLCVMYRVPFDAANQGANRICMYHVDFDGYKYVFVDYSASVTYDRVDVGDSSLNGHSIELVEQRNAVLKSSVYNSGFYVNATHVSGDSSYCVVKIKL